MIHSVNCIHSLQILQQLALGNQVQGSASKEKLQTQSQGQNSPRKRWRSPDEVASASGAKAQKLGMGMSLRMMTYWIQYLLPPWMNMRLPKGNSYQALRMTLQSRRYRWSIPFLSNRRIQVLYGKKVQTFLSQLLLLAVLRTVLE